MGFTTEESVVWLAVGYGFLHLLSFIAHAYQGCPPLTCRLVHRFVYSAAPQQPPQEGQAPQVLIV